MYNSSLLFSCLCTMGISFTPQGSSPTPTLEINPDETTINPSDDFFEIAEPAPEQNTAPQVEQTPPPPETEPAQESRPAPELARRETPAASKKPTPQVVAYPHPATLIHKDKVTVQIEKIMEEGIGDAYQELTPVQKQQFKIKGEETAGQIKQLLHTAKVKVKKIFSLILEWLSLLPGVNKFFLMQEAKIKTDKILALKNHIQ